MCVTASSDLRLVTRSRRRAPSRLRAALAILLALVVVLVASVAGAAEWHPPPLRGHVVDEAGALTRDQALSLDLKLDQARKQTGFAIVVLILPQLPQALSIEDVGYEAGNAWGVGSKAGDDGVILIASLADRKLRIETGRGVGGALTDLQSSHINREVIGPLMKQGRTYEAMSRGTDAILKELVENTPGGASEAGRGPGASRTAPPTAGDYVQMGVLALIGIGVIVLAIISPTFRHILFWMLLFGRGGGRGGGGFGGGGGSGYGGGGGSFGGGGSSDDY